jgi:hypothetical protein
VFPASCGLSWRVKRRWAPPRTRHPLPEPTSYILPPVGYEKDKPHTPATTSAFKKKVSTGLHNDYMTIISIKKKKVLPIPATTTTISSMYLANIGTTHPITTWPPLAPPDLAKAKCTYVYKNISSRHHHTLTHSLAPDFGTLASIIHASFHRFMHARLRARLHTDRSSSPDSFDGATGAARVLRTVGTQ